MRRRQSWIAVVALIWIANTSIAQEDDVFISWNVGGVADIDNDKVFVNGAWNITTTLTLTSSGDGVVIYRSASAGDPIRYIRVTANQAAGGSSNPDCSFIVTSDDPGAFNVPFVYELNHVSGNANSRMSITNTDDVGGGGADLVCGDIVDLIDIDGDLLADVESISNLVDEVLVGGTIGSVNAPITITSAGKIERIVADAIHADITTPITSGNFVQSIETTVGDFTGSLITRNLTCDDCGAGDPAGIDIASDLDAALNFDIGVFEPIDVGSDMTGTIEMKADLNDPITITGKLTGTIIIGDDLDDDITIDTADGLEGFITIDADDDGTGSWLGDVIVDTFTLGPNETGADEAPDYTRTVAQLGGGAIGVVAD